MNSRDHLTKLLRDLAASQPQFGRELPLWLRIHTAPSPDESTPGGIPIPAQTARWRPPGAGGIRLASSGGVKASEYELHITPQGLLYVWGRWWVNRLELEWRSSRIALSSRLHLTFLHPITGVAITPEIDAGYLSERYKLLDDCASLGFSPTRDHWMLELRVVSAVGK
jgi:hypothetical protein